MSSFTYRPDIDGLRAIAVTSVILNHLNAAWLPGGFIGVDIFFVISGFLITAIIHNEINHQEFTFSRFYIRRIKRILPVFFVVLLATLAVGALLLAAHELKHLGKSARYASLFASNFYLANTLDYFAPAADEIPLLHTWSLAVEEQYYFVWPGLLILLSGVRRKVLLGIASALCVASFVLASYWVEQSPALATLAFYHLPARFGELLIGSILAISKPIPRFPNLAALVGSSLLLASLLFLNEASPFPGYNAIWPCLGTALLIYAGASTRKTVFSELLSSVPFVRIGLLSYSLYLWHWPILSFIRYYTMENLLDTSWMVTCIGLTLALSWLSWRYIEQPLRRQNLNLRQTTGRFLLLPLALVLLAGFIIKKTDGHIFDTEQPDLQKIALEKGGCIEKIRDNCLIGTNDKNPSVLVFGDSHTAHFSILLDAIASRNQRSAELVSIGGCPFINSLILPQDKLCQQATAWVDQRMANYTNLVISMRWEKRFRMDAGKTGESREIEQAFSDKLLALANAGKQVYLIGQVVKYRHNVLRSHRLQKTENTVDSTYRMANRRLQAIASQHPNLHYVDFNHAISAWPNGIANGKPAYLDEDHINRYGQQLLLEDPATLLLPL